MELSKRIDVCQVGEILRDVCAERRGQNSASETKSARGLNRESKGRSTHYLYSIVQADKDELDEQMKHTGVRLLATSRLGEAEVCSYLHLHGYIVAAPEPHAQVANQEQQAVSRP